MNRRERKKSETATRTVDALDELVERKTLNGVDSRENEIKFEGMLVLELLVTSGNDDVTEEESGRESVEETTKERGDQTHSAPIARMSSFFFREWVKA